MGQVWGKVVLRDRIASLQAAIRRNDIRSIANNLETGVNLDKSDEEPPLCLACRIGNEKSVEALIQMENIDPEQEDRSGFTPLILAVYAGHSKIVKMLLHNNYVDVNRVSSSGATAFEVSIITGKYEIAQIIMDSPGFNVRMGSYTDIIEENILLVQCRRLNKEAVSLMLRAGYDMDVEDEVSFP